MYSGTLLSRLRISKQTWNMDIQNLYTERSGACVIKLITAVNNGHMTVKTNASIIKLLLWWNDRDRNYGQMAVATVKWL